MKSRLHDFIGSLLVVGVLICLLAFVAIPQDQKVGGAWVIPPKYKAMKNPLKGDAASLNIGKMLYAKHCKSCHGALGLGDGPKAGNMKTKINSLKDSKFQAQSDGEIYFQSFVGRDEMPNFEKKILEEEERWAIINFTRSLK